MINFSRLFKTKVATVSTAFALFASVAATAQESRVEPIPMGDMNYWVSRKVEESLVIGGKTKTIYEIAAPRAIAVNTPYVAKGSDWATSSVYAKVKGVTKGSVTVFPEARDVNDKCARLETRLEEVKVLGLINISVVATGSIFLGEIVEPIRDTKDPQAKLNTGIRYTKKPKALVFDYKVSPKDVRIYDNGFSRQKVLSGHNAAEAVILLQTRWEDSEGNLYAKRVGTGWERYDKEQLTWQNGHKVEVKYGDISSNSDFKSFQGLLKAEPIYSLNSKGEVKMVNEIGWADASATPTHMVVRFSSGYGGAYIGSIGSKFWIDNVKLEF